MKELSPASILSRTQLVPTVFTAQDRTPSAQGHSYEREASHAGRVLHH